MSNSSSEDDIEIDQGLKDRTPAFDLGTSPGKANITNKKVTYRTTEHYTNTNPTDPHMPETRSNQGRTDDKSSLPPNSMKPTTMLKREDSKSGLALPKKDERKTRTGAPVGRPPNSQKGRKNDPSAKQQSDPNKMQDVLFSAGVDIKEEEALLNSSVNLSNLNTLNSNPPIHRQPPLLHPTKVANFMKRVAREHSFIQNFEKNPDLLDMMSSALEYYMRDILTNALVVSRQRRRGIKVNAGRRSHVSAVLRNIALQQKKEEEKRVKKRVALGLEKEDYNTKVDSDETLHRASNVTAGLRAGAKKQYGWLTSSSTKATTVANKTLGKVASDIASRGENGLKYREAREEPGIVMRDLLYALENRRVGVQNIISKGYARIRD